MDVKDRLPSVTVAVEDRPIAAGGQPMFAGDCGGAPDQCPHEAVIALLQIVERRDVTLGNHEDMCGRLGIDVLEGHYLVVFIHALGGNLARHDLAKEARHAGSIAFSWRPRFPD